jgi:hypothetical protein
MSADDYFALREALRQGRWRKAKNPRAYIKTVVRREALHEKSAAAAKNPLVLMPAISEDDGVSVQNSLDRLSYVQDTSGAVKGPDGI